MTARYLSAFGRIALATIVVTALAACNSSNSKKYTIGGSIAGLGGTVILQNNGGDDLSASANGSFTFAKKIGKGKNYAVTVKTQPAGQTCVVANGSGKATANVTNVSVTCTNNVTYTVGGTISGLTGTVVLQNNGGNDLTRNANGAFTFSNPIAGGSAYAVTVKTQPAGQTCVVSGGAGAANADVTSVTVTCTTNPTYTIGGAVSGLNSGVSVVLQNNGGDDLTRGSNGAFTFPTSVAAGGAYAVTVKTQPAGQTCSVTNGAGNANANVTNVAVTCVTAAPVTHTIGGSITGLTGTVVLQNNGGDDLTRSANGAFTFPTAIADGAAYFVTVKTQPAGQTCVVSNGAGNAVANVTNVAVACSATNSFTISGSITGLKAGGLKLGASSTNTTLPPANATTFTLPNSLASGAEYWVGIQAQPTGQTCLMTHGHGVITANVTNVAVVCIDNVTSPLRGTYLAPIPGSLVYITLFEDGTYIFANIENNVPCGQNNGNGVEYGVYNWNSSTGAFSIKSAVIDTNGACGVWDNGPRTLSSGNLAKTGTGQNTVLTLTVAGVGQIVLTPVPSTLSSLIGSFEVHTRTGFAVFFNNATKNYLIAETQADSTLGEANGIEYGCYAQTGTTTGTVTANLNPATCQTPDQPDPAAPVDTNGAMGLSNAGGAVPYEVKDASVIQFAGVDGTTATRILPP